MLPETTCASVEVCCALHFEGSMLVPAARCARYSGSSAASRPKVTRATRALREHFEASMVAAARALSARRGYHAGFEMRNAAHLIPQ